MRKFLLVYGCLLLSAAASSQRSADSVLNLVRRPPLPHYQFQVITDSVREGIHQKEIRFEVGPGEWCTALYTPGKLVPASLVIFQHWGGGRKEYFAAEALRLAKAGFTSISLDAPWHWPTHDTAANPVRVYPDNILRSCKAITTVVNWCATDPHVDAGKIYFVGHSYGATLGGLILAAEPRIRGAVLMAGLPSISASMEEDPLGQWKGVKESMRPTYDSVVARLRVMEPEDLAARSTVPVLYQAATNDQYVPRQYSLRYIKALGKRVDARWYDTDHVFIDAKARADRMLWLVAQRKKK